MVITIRTEMDKGHISFELDQPYTETESKMKVTEKISSNTIKPV